MNVHAHKLGMGPRLVEQPDGSYAIEVPERYLFGELVQMRPEELRELEMAAIAKGAPGIWWFPDTERVRKLLGVTEETPVMKRGS